MLTKHGVVVLGVAALATVLGAGPVEAQLSGRVVLADGPVGVSIVFGERPARVAVPARVMRRAVAPARYRPGMSLYELDIYLERIDREYDFYHDMHPRDAYYHHGWSPRELQAYVHWLRDERRFLRDERRRLERQPHDRDHRGRGRGHGRW